MTLADLRFGAAPLPDAAPGFDPAGDALALFAPGLRSPAERPIPGRQVLDSLGEGQRFVLRLPDDWNGDLAVCGTPATRSEYANDLNLGDFLLARGYAFASSNKGIPYNAVVEPSSETPDPASAYPVPFDLHGLRAAGSVVRFGCLWPQRVPVERWHEDLAALTAAAKANLKTLTGRPPRRTFALGLSMGGSQVRYLLERAPELVDGGLEWASPFWSPDLNLLTYLPPFIRLMPEYVRAGYADGELHSAIEALGFPSDRRQADPAHPSLWNDHYANLAPFYADLTTYVFARSLDREREAWSGVPPNVSNPITGAREPRPINARGLALPEVRMAYVPSPTARAAIARFEHTGRIERPLVGLAGSADVFVPPALNLAPYAAAVRAAGRSELYRQYLVADATHVDGYAAYGYGLRPMLPFVWAAFEALVRTVDGDPSSGGAGEREPRTVSDPHEIG